MQPVAQVTRRRGRPSTNFKPSKLDETSRLNLNLPIDSATRIRTAAARHRMTPSEIVHHVSKLISEGGDLPEIPNHA